MAEIRFAAYQLRSGQAGVLNLLVPGFLGEFADDAELVHQYRKVVEFLRQKREKEVERAKKIEDPEALKKFLERGLLLWVDIEIYYKRATPGQYKLLMLMLRKIAAHDEVPFRQVYAGVRFNYFPDETDAAGNLVKKAAEDLTTVEMAKVIQAVYNEEGERVGGTDLSDVYVMWADWRHNKAPADPLEGTYKSPTEYAERNGASCEICAGPLIDTVDPTGGMRREGQFMHIVPDGAGGPASDDNGFIACTNCHMALGHEKGLDYLVALYPWIKGKVEKARAKYGGVQMDKPELHRPAEGEADAAGESDSGQK